MCTIEFKTKQMVFIYWSIYVANTLLEKESKDELVSILDDKTTMVALVKTTSTFIYQY